MDSPTAKVAVLVLRQLAKADGEAGVLTALHEALTRLGDE